MILRLLAILFLFSSCNVFRKTQRTTTDSDTTTTSYDSSTIIKYTFTKGKYTINTDTLVKVFPLPAEQDSITAEVENEGQKVTVVINKKKGTAQVTAVQKKREIVVDKTEKEIVKNHKGQTTQTHTTTTTKNTDVKKESKANSFIRWIIALVIVAAGCWIVILWYTRKNNTDVKR